MNKFYLMIALLASGNVFASANFSISPFGTIPTSVAPGQTVTASYTLTNMTQTPRLGYSVQGLPAGVTQNVTAPNCGAVINLNANASCILRFNITKPVTANFAICKGSSCTTASTPLNVSSTTVSIPRFAYVTQGYNAGVQVCIVNANDGSLSSCVDAGGGSLSNIYPQGIAIDSDGTHAYITEGYTSLSQVYQCNINATTGTFDSCSATNITSPVGYLPYYGLLALNSTSTYAYLVDYNGGSPNRILACPISSGTISPSCVDTGATGLTNDNAGIVLNNANTVAYLGGYGDSYITVCSVSGTTFSGCINKNGGGAISFGEPAGIALNASGTLLYVADNVSHNVFSCDTTYNATSSFNNCSIAGALPPGNPQPWSITLNKSGTVAYLADYNSIVYSCPILNDGTFSTCTQNTGFPQPVDVALKY